MILNRLEYAMMNNPVRAGLQRHFEAKRLLKMGGPCPGAVALEIGCGRGVGVETILDVFGAQRVDAFDLDQRMVARARSRLRDRGDRVNLWQGSVTAIDADDQHYDAAFDFGVIHHVPKWRDALSELHRVLRPGGRLYAEEVYARFIGHWLWRRLLKHPQTDRFDHAQFGAALEDAGFALLASRTMLSDFGWWVAERRA